MIEPSQRTEQIVYAVRDVVATARAAAAAGKELLYLNIGDPNQFDYRTPPHLVEAIIKALRDNRTSYAPSEGLPEALNAIRETAEADGNRAIRDVFIGNGASECIEIALASLVNEGDNVLVPSPGYPLYTAVLAKYRCGENAYYLDEENGWQPDLADIESKVNARTRAIVVINPNNPTGSVCDRATLEGIMEIAAKHRLVVFADEIYDRLVFDGVHHPMAAVRKDVPVLTFCGLSKAYLSPGLRLGWCIASGSQADLGDYIEAMHKLVRARLCANHAIQYAVAPALTGDQSHIGAVKEKLLARRAALVEALDGCERIRLVPPSGAFYAFPTVKLNEPDETWVARLIKATGVVVVHGSGFGQKPGTAHIRIVFLPPEPILKSALSQLTEFLQRS